jgi:hypothetical protein
MDRVNSADRQFVVAGGSSRPLASLCSYTVLCGSIENAERNGTGEGKYLKTQTEFDFFRFKKIRF